jgi:hypothetical protein
VKTRPLKLVALLLLMWLGMAAYWLLVPHRWQAPSPQAAAAGLTASPELPRTVFTGSDYAEQLLRPVFVPGRRPVAVAAEAISLDVPVDIRLLGVYGSVEEGGVLVGAEDGVRRVAIGQTFQGMTLMRIEGGNAFFLANGAERAVPLKPQPRAGSRPFLRGSE